MMISVLFKLNLMPPIYSLCEILAYRFLTALHIQMLMYIRPPSNNRHQKIHKILKRKQ